jgi:hypothetical protein
MPDGSSVHYDPARPTDVREGRFRLSRRGGEVICQYAEPGSDEFRILDVVPCDGAPAAEVFVECKGAEGSSITARILRVTVRAEQLLP